jgi:dUTP pyrophosphatase
MSDVLSKNDIKMLLNGKPPLIESYLNLEEQLQPNGVDFTLRDIFSLQSAGKIAVSNKERVVSKQSVLAFDEKGFIHLTPGIYSITYNEIVNLPKNVMALATPRSSLLRCGVTVNTAVWDAGYSGRSESLLVVYNQEGFDLQKDSRIVQLVFFRLSGDTDGYNGTYQRENI